MATIANLDQTIRQLDRSITDRLDREQLFKQEIVNNINTHLAALGVCMNTAAASQPGSAPANAAVQDFQSRIDALLIQIRRLQDLNIINQGESTRITGSVGNRNLKWNTQADKDRIASSPSSTAPSVMSGISSYLGFSSPPKTTKTGSPSETTRTGPPPSYEMVDRNQNFEDVFGQGEHPSRPPTGGWKSPKRTPKRHPKKKSRRR
jgi:hypothetical protein